MSPCEYKFAAVTFAEKDPVMADTTLPPVILPVVCNVAPEMSPSEYKLAAVILDEKDPVVADTTLPPVILPVMCNVAPEMSPCEYKLAADMFFKETIELGITFVLGSTERVWSYNITLAASIVELRIVYSGVSPSVPEYGTILTNCSKEPFVIVKLETSTLITFVDAGDLNLYPLLSNVVKI